jgi:hypothetical protein
MCARIGLLVLQELRPNDAKLAGSSLEIPDFSIRINVYNIATRPLRTSPSYSNIITFGLP